MMKSLMAPIALVLLAALGSGAEGASPPAPAADVPSSTSLDGTWTKMAEEGGSFALTTASVVRYGAGSSYASKLLTGTVRCTNATFGDPLFGEVKACYARAGAAAPVPPPARALAPAPDPAPMPSTRSAADIVDSALAIDPAAYRSIASQMGSELGLAYRYGPDAAFYGAAPGRPTLPKRADQYSRCKGTALPDGSNCLTSWQIGGPRTYDRDHVLAGQYSTNQAVVTFVADDPKVRAGVGDLQVSAFEYNTYAQKPQLLWQNGGGGIDSSNIEGYKASGALVLDGSARPIATARCGGPVMFCGESVVVFQNGLLATAGSTTARNSATARLAPNKVPTGIAMTNQSEFALVTVWDTVALKGQVAVVALAGLCDGCKPGGPYYEWWHEWWGVYPGLPNMGNIGFMKVLGYVDLPGMMAPTEVATTTGLHQFNTIIGADFIGQGHSPLSEHWQSFTPGGENYGRYAKGGVAVIISKSEQKAAFLDLKPLFSYLNGIYFSSNVGQVSNWGQGAGQWPPTFTEAAAAMPTVIKTVDLGARPTAVKTTVTKTGAAARAWVATQDGTLRIFSLGGYAPGAAVASPVPSEIAAKGTVAIGRNPTSLATSKGDPGIDDPVNTQLIVAARGDRKIQWVHFAADGNSGSISRTLQDSRMTDPIAVEDIDNFANVGYTLSVADYSSKSVLNYRYGPVIAADRAPGWGCQPPGGCPVIPTGDIAMEFGGAYVLQGKPFQINTSNVP